MVTEFGHIENPNEGVVNVCESGFYQGISTHTQDNKYAGWIAWAIWPDKNTSEPDRTCGFPGIIEDWSFKLFPTAKDLINSLSTPMPNGSVLDVVK